MAVPSQLYSSFNTIVHMNSTPLTVHGQQLRQLLEKTFSGSITEAETIQLIASYLALDGKSLNNRLQKKNDGAIAFKAIARELLKDLHSDDKTLSDYFAKLIQAYLENDEQSLARYLNETGPGSDRFKQYAERVQQENILVLGIPGSIPHTQHREKQAKERLELGKKYDWSLYTCQSIHLRDRPEKKNHDGIINWVRVTLPEKDAHWLQPHENDINTPIGWVRAHDHIVFSNDALRNYQFNVSYPDGIDHLPAHTELPAFKRVDLVTPARYDGIRFAPLAIYIAYEDDEATKPLFYVMEGGNALGQAKVLYPSTTNLANPVLMKTGYLPTPFSNADNYYLSHTEFDGLDPVYVSIKVYTEAELQKGYDNFHFQIQLALQRSSLEAVASLDNFLLPAKQLLDAFLRIMELSALGMPNTAPTPKMVIQEGIHTLEVDGQKVGEAVEHFVAHPEQAIRDLFHRMEQGIFDAADLQELQNHGQLHEGLIKKILGELKALRQIKHAGTHKEWQNQLANQVVQPLHYYKPVSLNHPRDKDSIVNILKKALETGNTVKAAGSGHSYSDIATTPDFFIDTHSLNAISDLTRPITGQLSQEMLQSKLQLGLQPIAWPNYDPDNHHALFETEAGITIKDLNDALCARNLGLMNMGGYDGQTIMGAISTSTHGSGISLQPFPDMLESLVLATTGRWNGHCIDTTSGKSEVYLYRIERTNGITDPAKYNDPTIILIQDDNCFNSVICSMGCMGVVYSIVMKVMQMYWLSETRYETTLDKVMELLAPNSSNAGSIPDKLKDVRNLEVLVHPYPMDGLKVLEMNPNTAPETYYPYFKCLITERQIVADPGGILERKGHRNFFTQLAGMFKLSFEIIVGIMNHIPEIIPIIVNTALKGLVDTNYINKYWHIYGLGLNQDAGFATEIGFSLEKEDGSYTQEHFQAAVDKIHAIAQNARVNGLQYQSSPFSLRFVKASDAHLSMMHGVNTCMIEMDMTTGTYGGPEIMMRYQNGMYALGGRPHWGLEFDHLTGSNDLLQQLYPNLENWMNVYNQFNSEGTFNNKSTDRLGFTKINFQR